MLLYFKYICFVNFVMTVSNIPLEAINKPRLQRAAVATSITTFSLTTWDNLSSDPIKREDQSFT